ncbi:MAG: hypothetical protein ABH837_02895 [bacterium]
MSLKDSLKSSIEGSGEITESLISAVSGIIKQGGSSISDIFGAVIDLGKEGVVDVTEGVKGVYVGAVKALKESGKSTENAIKEVSIDAEKAIGGIGEEGMEAISSAAKKGVEEAKEIVKIPFKE